MDEQHSETMSFFQTKYYEKTSFNRAFKKINERLNSIREMIPVESPNRSPIREEDDEAMLSRKPGHLVNCMSCDKDIVNMQGR